MIAEESQAGVEQEAETKRRAWRPAPLPAISGHPSEFRERAADTASVAEHRERPLKVFAIDPSRGGGPRNVVTLRIPYEPLAPGPIGRLVAVIDEESPSFVNAIADETDAWVGETYPPVNLDAPEILLSGGLEPSEMDLQSHQQMVYAVSMHTIGAFERALRRPLKWPWASAAGDRVEDRLRIYPHAGKVANAYYSPDAGAVYFGYFHRVSDAPDRSSEIVYTALGFDLVAHEVVHPILAAVLGPDQPSSPDGMAFQEAFADLVPLLLHFDFHDLVVETALRTGGRLHERWLAADLEAGNGEESIQAELRQSNPLLEIGGQFGEAAGMGQAIRLALTGKPDPTVLAKTEEPHARGAVMLAAVFDACMTIYARRTADLRRIGNVSPTNPVVSPDLALRMAAEATKTARHFLTICIRALDSLPKTSLRLGDYLGALIASDSEAVPTDEVGYRESLIASFRARGLIPEGATSLTEDGLRWWAEERARRSRPRGPRKPPETSTLPDIDRTGHGLDRRMLKTFAFDPSAGPAAGNRLSVSLPYELLGPGPVGRSVAVIDYDASNDRYYTSVDLEDAELLRRGGLDPSDIDPKFHQQMVYAVAMSTIERFETALGRAIRWPWAGRETKGSLGDRLRIYPHAMQEPNAYYDRRLRALLFGYFAASEHSPGRNLPGQIVYTCLSADIVAHETTHALLDSIQPYFLEATGPDAPAFHEALADVIALLGHFTYTDALLDTIQRTGGLIHRDLLNPDATPVDILGRVGAERSRRNPLVDLALQFGESLGNRAALRSALGRRPNPDDLRQSFEAHDRGAILVAAIFDAFFSVYLRRVADLLRIGRGSGAITPSGDIHPDLGRRLAREATDTAARVSSIAARALDFCPPVDIEFGDYLRALVTADYERAPDDPLGFRSAFIDGFRERGIYARRAASMTEEALRWDRATTGIKVEGLEVDPSVPRAAVRNAILLRNFARDRRNELGLDSSLPVRVNQIQSSTSEQLDRSGTLRTEFKVRVLQQRMVPLDPADPNSPLFKFRGGSTVVLDGAGRLKYVIAKRIDSEDRLARQRDYLSGRLSEAVAAAYRPREVSSASLTELALASLHRGL